MEITVTYDRPAEGPKSGPVTVGWLRSTDKHAVLYDPPERVSFRDTAKVLKLSDLCFAYRRVNGDSALLFGRAARDLAHKLNFRRGEAQACNDMAIILIDRSGFAEADSLLHVALAIRISLSDSAGTGAIYNKLGNVYQSQGLFEEALAANLSALRIFELGFEFGLVEVGRKMKRSLEAAVGPTQHDLFVDSVVEPAGSFHGQDMIFDRHRQFRALDAGHVANDAHLVVIRANVDGRVECIWVGGGAKR